MLVNSCFDDYDKWIHPITSLDDIITTVYVDEKKLNNLTCKSKQTCKCKKSGKKTLPGIKQVYFNEKAGTTAIVWDDGSDTTVVHCGEGEQFERYVGFCSAICKKLFESTSAVKRLIDEKDGDLAKKRKEENRQKKAAKKRAEEAKNREKKKQKEAAYIKQLAKRVNEIVPALLPDFDGLLEAALAAGDKDGDKEIDKDER